MLEFKIDVLETLKDKGYNTTRLRREKLLSEQTIQYIRKGIVPGNIALNSICSMLKMQPGSIIRWVPDPEEEGAE